MTLDHQTCYRALISRDSRFDGKFFAAVSTTSIYCRPICRVRQPKHQNVQFFKSAAAAEKAGFRPCLRCRPELAPGYSTTDSKSMLATHAKRLIDQGSSAQPRLQDIAARLGITDRYLRKIFYDKYGVRPIEYLQNRRLLTAKQLLTDSQLNIADIAFASGFNSVRRLNSIFKQQYGLSPSSIRKNKSAGSAEAFFFELGFRPPYAKQCLLDFLKTRLLSGMEHIVADSYFRTLAMYHPQHGALIEGWLRVKLTAGNSLSVAVAQQLLPCFSQLQQNLIRAFDLTNTPQEISAELKPCLPKDIPWMEGLRIPGCMDFFETGVRAILGQQIRIQNAVSLTHKFVQMFGADIQTPHEFLSRRFPVPEEITGLDLKQLASVGIYRQKAKAIHALAVFCCENPDPVALSCDPEKTLAALCKLPGIGQWTANYVALRGLGWQSASLATDAVVSKVLGEIHHKKLSSREISSLAQQWQPWSGYMYLNLWQWAHSNTP